MKKILSVVFLVAAMTVVAASFRTTSLLNGSDLILYTGTSATTFAYNDAYATNRAYANLFGTVTIPFETNSFGSIAATFSKDAPSWALGDGSVNNNAAISATITGDEVFTNTVTFTLIRSVNGGVDFDTAGHTFSFAMTPAATATTLVTNLNTTFLQGASGVRLWKVVSGSNGAVGSVTINRLTLGGWAP